jgi:thiosulfate dehydrogenase
VPALRARLAFLVWVGVAIATPGARASTLPHFPAGQYGALVRQGWQIFNDTPRHARQFVGNRLSCSDCHLDAGTRENAAPLWGAVPVYPRYQAKLQQVVTLAQRMQQCFEFSERGWVPPLDSETMLALTAYAHWTARAKPIGVVPAGAGLPVLPDTAQGADPVAGQALYASRCASCHGERGQGRSLGQALVAPPLWGLASYAQGAGMSNPAMAARFIWANMPLGQPFSLSPQQAKDVASYIDIQYRAPDPRKGALAWLPH